MRFLDWLLMSFRCGVNRIAIRSSPPGIAHSNVNNNEKQ